eukprot:gnl/MRDRNA2_/MRDRNA2_85174_c0_seq1.p1 gnl/MRDRNA2_/MRDRNA2_85174_c0~~gnl/MRDRNA2_/MRDRNA2_85174_c0_seq1.p1  ORF type:complete len:324 (-),score=30.96 gnl/MRDRNA2_/MRDRNA2_85174_c0_seq1:62-1033(-)
MLGFRIAFLTCSAFGLRLNSHIQKKNINLKPRAKYALVTLTAHDPGYVTGAHALGRSLSTFAKENNVDMLALFIDHASKKKATLTKKLQQAGWDVIAKDPISNPNHKVDPRFQSTYDKLHVFNLTDYERVIYIDADMIAVNTDPIKNLLTHPIPPDGLLAVPDCASHFLSEFNLGQEINTGLFVIKPSASLFEDLMDKRATTFSRDKGDQGFLSNYFNGRASYLPAKFNYIRSSYCIGAIDRDTSEGTYQLSNEKVRKAKHTNLKEAEALAAKDINHGRIVFAHFHFQPKPWTCKSAKKCGARWEAGETGIRSIYEKWARWSK